MFVQRLNEGLRWRNFGVISVGGFTPYSSASITKYDSEL